LAYTTFNYIFCENHLSVTIVSRGLFSPYEEKLHGGITCGHEYQYGVATSHSSAVASI
jgi:hypothetical protein